MQLKLYEFDMKLKHPFSISRHTYFSQANIIIELYHNGISGFGEATVNPYYNITIDNLKATFVSMGKRLENYVFRSPDQLFEDFSDFLPINSFALGALNNASWDLFGKLSHKPVASMIELPLKNKPLTSFTLGIAEKNEILQKMQELPWPVYKIKLGTPNDLELVEFVRNHTNSIIRVDANCAWDVEKTVALSKKLKNLDVEFIEQPLPANDIAQSECYTQSALPLVADESCCIASDVEKCPGKFHGINIKLLKCGGLSPAIQMINKARKERLKVMVGCMTETTVGISAAAQLLPYVDYVDLDGPLLLAEDVAEGLNYDNGKIHVSGRNGLGFLFKGKE